MKSSHITLLFGLLLAAGCDKPATKIGTACRTDGDCNVGGQRCVKDICTKACGGQFGDKGCPIGYNCTIGNPAVGLTCNKVPFSVNEMGAPLLFGRSCAANPAVCMGTGDPNGAPACRLAEDPRNPGTSLKDDPVAYCSGSCSTDADCPFDMVCLDDYDNVKKCLKRQRCSECTYNDNCPATTPACVPTQDGTSKYCTSICKTQDDCPGSAQGLGHMACVPGQDADGNVGSFCFHKFGACVGAGEICDPCRTKADCAKSASGCIENDQTSERFCSKRCTSATACASPNPTGCDNVDPMKSVNICTGDARNDNPGVLSCYF